MENGSYGKELQAGTYRGVTQDELNIQVPSLNHFWFVQPENDIHTSSFVSGTIQGHTDSGYQVDIASGQWNPGPIPASHFKIEIRWENGHLKSKSCHPADVCALYFDGTVQEVQLTSSVEKEFVW